MTRFVIDASWHRPRDRHVVVGGSPVRMFRLTDAGVAVADAIEANKPLPAGHQALTNRLVAAGAIHPVVTESVDSSSITVVIPTYVKSADVLERVERLASSLAMCRVVIVDDASPLPVPPALAGSHVIRRHTNGGPAAARNTALRDISTQFVAFVDDDVSVSTESLCRAAAYCVHDAVLCAPRVRDAGASTQSPTSLARYESVRSPLDMGDKPARIAPLTRVSYAPAALLVARTDAVRNLGGFDESLRVGEDVDFVWRLSATQQCRYEPSIVAQHESRTTLRAFLAQRANYGSSAASLAARHGSLVAPYASNLLLFLLVVTASIGLYVVTALCVLIHIAHVTNMVRRAGDDAPHAVWLSTAGLLHACRVFADAIFRAWLPLYAAIVIVIPRLWWIAVACAIVPGVVEWWTKKPMNLAGFLVLRILDNSAYCAGVWKGVLRTKSARCLAPRITLSRRRDQRRGA